MPVPTPRQAAKQQDEETPLKGRHVTLAEIKTLLEREQADRGDLTYEQKLALDHSTHFTRLPLDQAEELVKKLTALGGRVTEAYAHKIVDVLPTHADDVRAIFAKDRVAPEAQEIDKIIETVGGYL